MFVEVTPSQRWLHYICHHDKMHRIHKLGEELLFKTNERDSIQKCKNCETSYKIIN